MLQLLMLSSQNTYLISLHTEHMQSNHCLHVQYFAAGFTVQQPPLCVFGHGPAVGPGLSGQAASEPAAVSYPFLHDVWTVYVQALLSIFSDDALKIWLRGKTCTWRLTSGCAEQSVLL